MYGLQITYVMGGSQTFLYGDKEEAAEADYNAVRDALKEFRLFKNDTGQIVTLTGDGNGTATIRIDQIASVHWEDLAKSDALNGDWNERIGKLEAVRERAKKRALVE